MSIEVVGIAAFVAMFLLMLLRIPVAVAMIIPALLGTWYIVGLPVVVASVHSVVWERGLSYTLVTIPMFVLMGEGLYASGVTSELYSVVRAWFGRVKGGLAMATIGASAMFAAASGSSVATTGTMGVVASKEMTEADYDKRLASGSIVAGGGLGILIPPSTTLILYGVLTEQSIGKLLIAGLVPGVVLTLLFILTVGVVVSVKRGMAPSGVAVALVEKVKGLRGVMLIAFLFVLVIGGMYGGFFTPTEAASVGAFGTLAIGLASRKLTIESAKVAVQRSVRTTGFIFAIILGSFLLNYLLAVSNVAASLASFVSGWALPTFAVFMMIVLMYIVLGAIMDAFAMLVITIPIVLPVIEVLGLNTIWFGVVIVVLIEIALITPPIGMNCFVLHGVAPDLGIGRIFKGAALFMVPMLTLILLLYAFPGMALYLPSHM